jgi:hypothetical protein
VIPTTLSHISKWALLAAVLTSPMPALTTPAAAQPWALDPATCAADPAAPGCPITNPADPRCNVNPAAAGCMVGAPMGPADPRCIAMPTGPCVGGPYDPTR